MMLGEHVPYGLHHFVRHFTLSTLIWICYILAYVVLFDIHMTGILQVYMHLVLCATLAIIYSFIHLFIHSFTHAFTD